MHHNIVGMLSEELLRCIGLYPRVKNIESARVVVSGGHVEHRHVLRREIPLITRVTVIF
jgi:hypothetical protein